MLDEVLARDAGLGEVPDYEWRSLLELGEKEQAEAAKIKAEALRSGVDAGAMDEDEMRTALDGDPVFGDLPGDAPEPDPDLDPGMPGPGGPPMPGPGGPQPGGGNGNGDE